MGIGVLLCSMRPVSPTSGLETVYPSKRSSLRLLTKALSNLKLRSTILDGEVVAVDEKGIPRFHLLQRFQKQPTAPTLYYVFDVLWCDGEDITGKPVVERRRVLERIIKPKAGIQVGTYIEGEGRALFDLIKQEGMEGIIAKRKLVLPARDAGF